MPCKPTRQQAREQINSAFQAVLSKVIPADEDQPLRGRTFSDFEDQVEEASRIVAIEMLQRRAELDAMLGREASVCARIAIRIACISARPLANSVRLRGCSNPECKTAAAEPAMALFPSTPRLATPQRGRGDAHALRRVPQAVQPNGPRRY